MNIERAAMKGKLAGLGQEECRLDLRIEAAAKAISLGLNTTLHETWELEIPQLDEQWDVLKTAWAELIKVRADIARIERELR